MATGDIKQRITLDGLDDIKAKLAQFGVVGEKAFAQVKAAVDKQPLAQASAQMEKFKSVTADALGEVQKFIGQGSIFSGQIMGLAGRFAGPLSLGILGTVGAFAALTK